METSGELSKEVIAALSRGNKIEAIKVLRQESGISLNEAKDRVDAYVFPQPAVPSERTRSKLRWFMAAIFAFNGVIYLIDGRLLPGIGLLSLAFGHAFSSSVPQILGACLVVYYVFSEWLARR